MNDVIKQLKAMWKMVMVLLKYYWDKIKKWILALLGLCLMIGCSGIAGPPNTSMRAYCTSEAQCQDIARASCPNGVYRVYTSGKTEILFDCADYPDNRARGYSRHSY